MKERVIGIDLALTHQHRASIWDSSKRDFLGKSFRFDRSYNGFEALLERCQKNFESDPRFIFVMEPTSMAWLPLSCYLIAKGHTVYLVNPQKVSALRKFFGLNKSDRLNSQTLTKADVIQPKSLHSVYVPPQITKSIDRFTKQRAKLVKHTSSIKRRLWHLFTFINPKALEA
jgi:transposase